MQKTFLSTEKTKTIWSTFSFVLAGCILIIGICTASIVSGRIAESDRVDLLRRVQTAAYVSNEINIAALTGTSADVSTDAYKQVKQELYDIASINDDMRFVYFMRAAGDGSGKLVFLADSEHPDSTDYSPPGQVYEETTAYEFSQYQNEASYIEGPYHDRWGTWVSAYAPIKDASGQQIAELGMDVSAARWNTELAAVWTSCIVIALLLAGAFITLGMRIRRSFSLLGKSERMNEFLSEEKERAETIVDEARVGEWTLIPKSGSLSFNSVMYELFGLEKGAPLDLDVFLASLTHESKTSFMTGLEQAYTTNTRDYRASVVNAASGKTIRIRGAIDYGSGMLPVRVTGIAQELG